MPLLHTHVPQRVFLEQGDCESSTAAQTQIQQDCHTQASSALWYRHVFDDTTQVSVPMLVLVRPRCLPAVT